MSCINSLNNIGCDESLTEIARSVFLLSKVDAVVAHAVTEALDFTISLDTMLRKFNTLLAKFHELHSCALSGSDAVVLGILRTRSGTDLSDTWANIDMISTLEGTAIFVTGLATTSFIDGSRDRGLGRRVARGRGRVFTWELGRKCGRSISGG